MLNIDLDADLAPAFNWNVKQLFAFVVAEYKTKTNPVNQARPLHNLVIAHVIVCRRLLATFESPFLMKLRLYVLPCGTQHAFVPFGSTIAMYLGRTSRYKNMLVLRSVLFIQNL